MLTTATLETPLPFLVITTFRSSDFPRACLHVVLRFVASTHHHHLFESVVDVVEAEEILMTMNFY